MRAKLKQLRYYVWLLFGGRAGFMFLAKSTQDNRKLIGELRNCITGLEIRIWNLEDHTPEETLTNASEALKRWQKTEAND